MNRKGFTLLELMFVVVICGILVSLSYPSLQTMIKTVRRHWVQLDLIELHLQQQNYYLTHHTFASLNELKVPDSHYYELFIHEPTDSSFVIMAEAKSNQKEDNQCDSLSINAELVKTPLECW